MTLPNGTTLVSGRRSEIIADQTWFEPFIGLRASAALSENWSLSLRGDVGGFGVNHSAFSWQIVPAVEYQWTYQQWQFGALIGYRALGQDYEADGLTWDVVTHGPLVGFEVAYRF